jgi:glutathione S-transferase
MSVKLYGFTVSHPVQAARKMLELKGIEFQAVTVMPGMQRIHLRLAGFRGGTVPALKLGGRRIQGSRRIARAAEQLKSEPRLFPDDPELRARVEEAERWGDEELQSVPRRIIRWGLVHNLDLRRWLAEESDVPMPAIAAHTGGPPARYYARASDADEAAVRRDLEALPQMLDRADALLADGTLTIDPPNAATLQVLCTVRSLDTFSDLHEHVSSHPSAAAARQLFPDYPEPSPSFLPPDWLTVLALHA